MTYQELAALPYGTFVYVDTTLCYTTGEIETEGRIGVFLQDEDTQTRDFLVEPDGHVLEWQRRDWRTTLWDVRHHIRRA